MHPHPDLPRTRRLMNRVYIIAAKTHVYSRIFAERHPFYTRFIPGLQLLEDVKK